MALERFRSGGARGIARFLSDHQHCDAGFDVRREAGAGTGRLSITCKGCGEGITYKAAEAGELAAGPELVNGDGAGARPAAAPPAAPPPPEQPKRLEATPLGPSEGAVGTSPVRGSRGRLPGWIQPALIALVILAGLVLVAVGISRSFGGDESPQQPVTSAETTAPAETAPAETAAPPPAETTPSPQPPPSQGVNLTRRDVDGRYAIGVPRGWRSDSGDGALSIAAPGGVAAIRVFYESGAESDAELAEGAARFLADEHDGAQVSRPQRVRVGSVRGYEVTAAYGGGEETAMVLTRGGYSYLVLRRVDNGASEPIAAEATASFNSFRAKR